jgi:hypothetical protein
MSAGCEQLGVLKTCKVTHSSQLQFIANLHVTSKLLGKIQLSRLAAVDHRAALLNATQAVPGRLSDSDP